MEYEDKINTNGDGVEIALHDDGSNKLFTCAVHHSTKQTDHYALAFLGAGDHYCSIAVFHNGTLWSLKGYDCASDNEAIATEWNTQLDCIGESALLEWQELRDFAKH